MQCVQKWNVKYDNFERTLVTKAHCYTEINDMLLIFNFEMTEDKLQYLIYD